jgi:hypothetical protein
MNLFHRTTKSADLSVPAVDEDDPQLKVKSSWISRQLQSLPLPVKILLGIVVAPVLLFLVLCIPAFIWTLFNPPKDPCSFLTEKTFPNPDFRVPIIIHTQLRDPSKPPFQHFSWTAAFDSRSSHMYWTDGACWDLVSQHYPAFLAMYKAYPLNIQRLDSCRYFILDHYGGVYKDGDMSLVLPSQLLGATGSLGDRRTLDKYAQRFLMQLPSSGVGVVESPYKYNEHVQNSLMSSTQHHPFWREVVFPLLRERGGSKGVLESTGPGLLSEALRRWAVRHDPAHTPAGRLLRTEGGPGSSAGVSVLPCELFQRVPLGSAESTRLNILGRELLTRLVPMKACGDFQGQDDCQITRHYGSASWTKGSLK